MYSGQQGLQIANEHLEKGIIPFEAVQRSLESPEPDVATRAGGGVNAVRYHWWGYQIFANDTTTHDLLKGAQASGGAISAILLALGVTALLAAAVAAIVFLAAGAIFMIDSWGGHNGIVLSVLWNGNFTIWHQ